MIACIDCGSTSWDSGGAGLLTCRCLKCATAFQIKIHGSINANPKNRACKNCGYPMYRPLNCIDSRVGTGSGGSHLITKYECAACELKHPGLFHQTNPIAGFSNLVGAIIVGQATTATVAAIKVYKCNDCKDTGAILLFSSIAICNHSVAPTRINKNSPVHIELIKPGHIGYYSMAAGKECADVPNLGWHCTREASHSGKHAGHTPDKVQQGTWD